MSFCSLILIIIGLFRILICKSKSTLVPLPVIPLFWPHMSRLFLNINITHPSVLPMLIQAFLNSSQDSSKLLSCPPKSSGMRPPQSLPQLLHHPLPATSIFTSQSVRRVVSTWLQFQYSFQLGIHFV